MHSIKLSFSRLAYVGIATLCVIAPVQGVSAVSSAANLESSARKSAFQPHLRGPIQLVASLGTVTSIVRSVDHNRRVGGVPNSYHLAGYAFDLRRNAGVTHKAIEAALRRAGYSPHESLDENDHSHFAFLPASKSQALNQPAPSDPRSLPKKVAVPVIAADEHGVLSLVAGELLSSGKQQ
ncbi:D-Ala-D-Ala carboxypeptidase family metallohydrolase [Sphingomonas glaciei]|uniref:D-Ala-D-Ala carboxypeptidase family metallohydrolase n=1 Tax=Sphingomonas glaciei TaxID=2938948 RepID=UPI0038738D3D